MPRQKLSPTTLLARQREKQAFDLRLAGVTFADIAERLDYRWPSSAHAAVMRYLKRLGPPHEAEEMRHVQVQRLHRLVLAAWQAATGARPDWRAQQQVVNVLKEISALLGLYPPKQVAVDATVRREDLLEGATIEQIYDLSRSVRDLQNLAPEDRAFVAGLVSQMGGVGGEPGEAIPDTDGGADAGDG